MVTVGETKRKAVQRPTRDRKREREAAQEEAAEAKKIEIEAKLRGQDQQSSRALRAARRRVNDIRGDSSDGDAGDIDTEQRGAEGERDAAIRRLRPRTTAR